MLISQTMSSWGMINNLQLLSSRMLLLLLSLLLADLLEADRATQGMYWLDRHQGAADDLKNRCSEETVVKKTARRRKGKK